MHLLADGQDWLEVRWSGGQEVESSDPRLVRAASLKFTCMT